MDTYPTYSADLPASVTITLTGGQAMAVLRALPHDAAYQQKACEPVRYDDSKGAFAVLSKALQAARTAESVYSGTELLELFQMLLRSQIFEERINSIEELHGLLRHVEDHFVDAARAKVKEAV